MAGNVSRTGATVTSRALALLGAFDDEHRSLSLSRLAARAELPVPTAHRLVGELVAWGALSRTQAGEYVVGRRLWDVGLLAPVQTGLRQLASPFLHDLYGATLATVHLAVRDGTEVLYLDRLAGNASVPVVSSIGSRLPMHSTGVGKVLLAHAPAGLVREAVLAGLHGYTPHTIVTAAHLHRTLADIRRTGVGYAREELAVGSFSAASPVLDADGGAVAALSVTLRAGLGNRAATLRRVGPAVRTAALSASRGLQRRAWPEPPDGSEGGRRSRGRDPSVRVTGLLAPG